MDWLRLASRNILLVDDDESFLETFNKILVSEGYYVETANSGKEALSKLSSSDYDIVILNIVLSDIRGDDIVLELRAMDKEIKIILITGFSHLQRSINTIQPDVVDILLKPIDPVEILTALEIAFAGTYEQSQSTSRIHATI